MYISKNFTSIISEVAVSWISYGSQCPPWLHNIPIKHVHTFLWPTDYKSFLTSVLVSSVLLDSFWLGLSNSIRSCSAFLICEPNLWASLTGDRIKDHKVKMIWEKNKYCLTHLTNANTYAVIHLKHTEWYQILLRPQGKKTMCCVLFESFYKMC